MPYRALPLFLRRYGAPLWLAALLLPVVLPAQTLYRGVGPNGEVIFSDLPPQHSPEKATTLTIGKTKDKSSHDDLPYELRQISAKYPVTLFAAQDCMPCDEARNLLNQRGIPFSEKTVTSNEDITALKHLSDDTSLPLLAIGQQQLHGYSEAEWNQYLDAAGYPKNNQLPSTYQPPKPSALVALEPTKPSTSTRAKATGHNLKDNAETHQQPIEPAPTTPSNPGGIEF